jgi:hypothetical protein
MSINALSEVGRYNFLLRQDIGRLLNLSPNDIVSQDGLDYSSNYENPDYRIPIICNYEHISGLASKIGVDEEFLPGFIGSIIDQLRENNLLKKRKFPENTENTVVEGHFFPVACLAIEITRNLINESYLNAEQVKNLRPKKVFKIALAHDVIESIISDRNDSKVIKKKKGGLFSDFKSFLSRYGILNDVLTLSRYQIEPLSPNVDAPIKENGDYAKVLIEGGLEVWITKIADMLHNWSWDMAHNRNLSEGQAKKSLDKNLDMLLKIEKQNPSVAEFFKDVLTKYGYPVNMSDNTNYPIEC